MLKLFALIKPFRASVAIVAALALAQSLANLYLPRLMADIVDHGIVPGDTRKILQIGGLMLLVAIAGTICAVAGSYFSAKVATGFGRVVRGRVFDRVSHFSVHQFDRFSTASLITRTTNDTTQVQSVLLMLLGMAISAPMMAIGGVALSLSQDARLARVLIAVIPILAVVFFVIMWKAVPLYQLMQVQIDRLNLVLDEGLSGVRVIRAFDRGAHQSRRFDAANRDVTSTAITVNRLVALLFPAMFFMMNVTSILIIWFGAGRIDAGADARRRDDRLAAVRHPDPLRRVHGHGGVRHAAARGGVGRAHQRSARRDPRRQRSRAAADRRTPPGATSNSRT